MNPHTARRRHTVGFLLRRRREAGILRGQGVKPGAPIDSFANARSAARARLVYTNPQKSKKVRQEGDLTQERTISFATIRLLGSLVGEQAAQR